MKTYIFLGVDWDAKPVVSLASNTEMMFANTVKLTLGREVHYELVVISSEATLMRIVNNNHRGD